MANLPPRPCEHCRRALVRQPARLCPRCEPKHGRGTATERGYDHTWRKLRDAFIAANPWCVECARNGRQVRAQIVDHIVPHCGREELRLNVGNVQSLCRSHHALKTHGEGLGYIPMRLRVKR
jgi:5-methylcytosine-specific restriction protein A